VDRERHEARRHKEGWTTREGEFIRWADIDTRHLWNVVRMQARAARKMTRMAEEPTDERVFRKALLRMEARRKRLAVGIALDELDFRGLLPTIADLHVAWDRACGAIPGTVNVADDSVET
jgi:hypothetical protein